MVRGSTYQPKFELKIFEYANDEVKHTILYALLEALIVADLEWLRLLARHGIRNPSLYEWAPQYVLKVHPAGLDSWQDIAQTMMLRAGDCKDFACWRVAELRFAGYADVKPYVRTSRMAAPVGSGKPPITIHHILVRRGLHTEDPSRILGMPDSVSYAQIEG
jgi:hypothetical protein